MKEALERGASTELMLPYINRVQLGNLISTTVEEVTATCTVEGEKKLCQFPIEVPLAPISTP
jgi:hypothetical protein